MITEILGKPLTSVAVAQLKKDTHFVKMYFLYQKQSLKINILQIMTLAFYYDICKNSSCATDTSGLL